MKPLPTLFLLASLLAAVPAHALGNLADVRVIDRTTGQRLPIYHGHGAAWIAGTPGHRYAIEIENRDTGRVLAVTSVDGLNVLTGQTAAFDQSGYVFYPGSRYAITGWRKSNDEVAAFEFTAQDESYAVRTGRPANVGVLGVALFRERVVPAIPYPPLSYEEIWPQAKSRLQDTPASGLARAEQRAEGAAARPAAPAAMASAPHLGTGHGARETSEAYDTQFERAGSAPDEVLALRYDSYEHLVELGVIPRRLPAPHAFPGSDTRGFVPDPPR